MREAMASVVTQLEDSDQYIVIDGGSEDGSPEIIQSFESRLHYWQSRRDRGPADALNQALEAASRPYFYYINADDYVLPGALFRLRQFLTNNPIKRVGIIGYGLEIVENIPISQFQLVTD